MSYSGDIVPVKNAEHFGELGSVETLTQRQRGQKPFEAEDGLKGRRGGITEFPLEPLMIIRKQRDRGILGLVWEKSEDGGVLRFHSLHLGGKAGLHLAGRMVNRIGGVQRGNLAESVLPQRLGLG